MEIQGHGHGKRIFWVTPPCYREMHPASKTNSWYSSFSVKDSLTPSHSDSKANALPTVEMLEQNYPDKSTKTNHPHKRRQKATAEQTLLGAVTPRNHPQFPPRAQHGLVLAA